MAIAQVIFDDPSHFNQSLGLLVKCAKNKNAVLCVNRKTDTQALLCVESNGVQQMIALPARWYEGSQFYVSLTKLTQFVGQCKNNLLINVDGENVHCRSSRAAIALPLVQSYLDIAGLPESPTHWRVDDPQKLKGILSRIKHACENDKGAHNLRGIKLESFQGQMTIVGLSPQLSAYSTMAAPCDDLDVILPAPMVDAIIASIGKSESTISLYVGAETLFIKMGNITIAANVPQIAFPQWRRLYSDIARQKIVGAWTIPSKEIAAIAMIDKNDILANMSPDNARYGTKEYAVSLPGKYEGDEMFLAFKAETLQRIAKVTDGCDVQFSFIDAEEKIKFNTGDIQGIFLSKNRIDNLPDQENIESLEDQMPARYGQACDLWTAYDYCDNVGESREATQHETRLYMHDLIERMGLDPLQHYINLKYEQKTGICIGAEFGDTWIPMPGAQDMLNPKISWQKQNDDGTWGGPDPVILKGSKLLFPAN